MNIKKRNKYSSRSDILHKELAHIEEKRGWWFIGKRKIIADTVARFRPQGEKINILDVGCGTGFILEALQSIGTVYGVDINKQAVKICHNKGLKHVIQGSILKLPFKNNFFHTIVLADIIEHIKNDTKALKEVHRVLKKDGMVIIHTPSQKIPWSALDEDFEHIRRYTKERLEKIIQTSGLKVQKLSYTNFFLYFPILFIRALQQKNINALGCDPTGMKLLPKPIEKLFGLLFSSEAYILRFFNLPTGVSLLVIAKKDLVR